MVENSDMIFLNVYRIELEKKLTRRYARLRYYAENDLKLTSLRSNRPIRTPNDL